MRYQGSLVEWNDARGFGFVRRHGSADWDTPDAKVFAHISAFPRGSRPVVGDIVTYAVQRDERGRPRAMEIALPALAHAQRRRRRHGASQPVGSWLRGALTVAALVAAALAGWKHYAPGLRDAPAPTAASNALPSALHQADAPQFTCQGKRSCPQMTSCAEATFYLQHCPGTLSDGDGDGIPCEDQWCGH